MRHYKLYIGDILDAIVKIEKYTKGFTPSKFQRNSLVADAVVKNLEVIGEASKRIPADIKHKIPAIEWKKIVGLRNIFIHEYSAIDKKIVWDIIENKLPALKAHLTQVLKS